MKYIINGTTYTCTTKQPHGDLREMLIEDIRETGLRTEDGKDNTSPKQLPIVNRQMLSLLKTLGVTTDNIVGEEDDDL